MPIQARHPRPQAEALHNRQPRPGPGSAQLIGERAEDTDVANPGANDRDPRLLPRPQAGADGSCRPRWWARPCSKSYHTLHCVTGAQRSSLAGVPGVPTPGAAKPGVPTPADPSAASRCRRKLSGAVVGAALVVSAPADLGVRGAGLSSDDFCFLDELESLPKSSLFAGGESPPDESLGACQEIKIYGHAAYLGLANWLDPLRSWEVAAKDIALCGRRDVAESIARQPQLST